MEGETMERTEWLQRIRETVEGLYDYLAPEYWVTFGLYENETHLDYLQKFLKRMAPHSTLLSAACGAGRYDGVLLEAGHSVVGIDQSAGMLRRAREHFPGVRYEKVGLHEMDFHEEFDGAVCIDAMEHVFPEDWQVILRGFHDALKQAGALYFTVELPDTDLTTSYERAKGMGLPVVFGELADEVESSYERVKIFPSSEVPKDLAGAAAYHYYPSLDQVRTWLAEAGFVVEEEGTGNGYEHFVVRKK
jgi:cyclopropane fatty-acyl-phospholipid synthase-like methyltransferase